MSAPYSLIETNDGGNEMENTHCFAYINEHSCNALNEKKCYNCPFYKSKMQYDREMQSAMKLCREKGITKYNGFFRYYKLKKLLALRGDDKNESANDISK